MKNAKQLLELLYIEASDSEIRELLEAQYQDMLCSNDSYFRYYPDDDTYDKVKGLTDKVNEYLIKQGYTIEGEDEYFHILIRLNW